MEKTFNKILKDFTIIMGGKYAGYFALGITLAIIAVFICQLIFSVVKGKKSKYSYTKFIFFTSFFTLLVSICEFYTSKKVFQNVYYCIIFSIFNFLLGLTFSFVLGTINAILDKKSKSLQTEKPNEFEPQKLPVSNSTKKALMHLKAQPIDLYNLENSSNDFIDVEYLKSLIDLLKSKPLTIEETERLEELEVFLLNFCYRRPNKNEKEKLSVYLSFLMKKLAYYKIVE
ncbi:MAG: hypothetical protein IJW26_06140 [Clostridia bacterium]|nr:hypothetical protein [Clostridia bacterium]